MPPPRPPAAQCTTAVSRGHSSASAVSAAGSVRLTARAGIPDSRSLPEGFSGTLGYFPVYFPDEIAHAAGLLPVNILGGGNKLEMKHADARMGSFVCSICRSTTELGLNGTLQSLSAFVTHPICDAAKHLAGIWSRNLPDQGAEILYLPQNPNSPGAARYVAAEYQRLRAELARKIGHPISDAAIRSSRLRVSSISAASIS